MLLALTMAIVGAVTSTGVVAKPRAPTAIPRVLLVSATGAESLGEELRTIGFIVLVRQREAGLPEDDIVDGAERTGAFCVVIEGDDDVRVVAIRSGAVSVIERKGLDDDVFVVKVAERVRGLLVAESLRPRTVIVQEEAPVDASPSSSTAMMLRGAVSGRVATYLGGLPPHLQLDVEVGARPIEHLELGVRVAVPAGAAAVESDVIAADVAMSAASVFVALPFRPDPHLELAVSAAAGPLWMHIGAQNTGAVRGLSRDVVVALVEVDAGVRFAVLPYLWVGGGVRFSGVTPRPQLVVDDEVIAAVDGVGGSLYFGISGTFPDALAEADQRSSSDL